MSLYPCVTKRHDGKGFNASAPFTSLGITTAINQGGR